MKKDIIIVGASGFGREVAFLLEELNEYHILGFVDDNQDLIGTYVMGYPVLGDSDMLCNYKQSVNVALAIAKPSIRKMLIQKMLSNPLLKFPNLIAKGVRIHQTNKMGIGNIICQECSLTVDICIGDFNHINPNSTLGHDIIFDNYITIYPGCNISGNVFISDSVELGTGTKVIQGLRIGENIVVGAGSVIIKNIMEAGVYVGVPVKKVK